MSSVAVSNLSQGVKNQLAGAYAALLLNDSKLAISADNIEKVFKAANLKVQKYL